MKKFLYTGLVASALLMMSCGGDDDGGTPGPIETTFEQSFLYDDDTTEYVTIQDFGNGVGTTTFEKNKVYVLDGFVFVNEGQTLTIEAGTIIKGKSGQGENASALVVAKGGKIMAEGTSSAPIIFTAEADGTNRNTNGEVSGEDGLGKAEGGLWGGLIVLGKAGLNSDPGTSAIEGIPTTETRGIYGGDNDEDNSGVLKYISIRHGGTNIGAGNEINGLTLGGVGSETEIDYVEVIGNNDDGIEFFGGTANVKHALVANVGDDSFDYDEGYRGKGQFWVSIDPNDRHGEHDGGTNPETGTPYATPVIYNASYIGGDASRITFRDNAGGEYHNSIFESFTKSLAIEIEDLLPSKGDDSRNQYDVNENLKIEDNVFANADDLLLGYIVETEEKDEDGDAIFTKEEIDAIAIPNESATTQISSADPVPATAFTATSASDSWFTAATYKGAFDDTNWAQGWTLYYAD